MDYTNLQQVLMWLTGVGGPAIVLYGLSYLAENWAAWTTFPQWVKVSAPIVLSIVIGIGSTLLLQRPDIIEGVAPWYQMIATIALAYIASQKAYMSTKVAEYGVRYSQPTSETMEAEEALPLGETQG